MSNYSFKYTMKNLFLIINLLCPILIFGQGLNNNSIQNINDVSNFTQLSQQQLFDTAKYFYNRNSIDTALVCYNLIINSKTVKENDPEQQKRVINSLNITAVIHAYMCDYRSAYKYLIDALFLSEKYNMVFEQPNIYNNLGTIYSHFKKYDIAKSFYYKALSLCEDEMSSDLYLNNLGYMEVLSGNIDSAFYFLNKSLQICKRFNNDKLHLITNSIASLYQNTKQYDSAFYYYKLSLCESRKNNNIEHEVKNLSDLGKLFFEISKPDSAIFYINLSNTVAAKNNSLKIMADNYFALSEFEESKGNTKKAFEYFKKYTTINDSVLNKNILWDINQLQRLYEVSKTNQQIEELIIEQKIKERTIHYQRIIQNIIIGAFLTVSFVLLVIIFQNKKIRNAYRVLFDKNVEIIKLSENSTEKENEKNKGKNRKNKPDDDIQKELLNRILSVMKDTSVFCNPSFTLDNLATFVKFNHNYVSDAIYTAFNKNFRSFLNSYRIKEAQRIFSDSGTEKYTIEHVAFQVGFKSRSAFREVFKEITGVSPAYYMKSLCASTDSETILITTKTNAKDSEDEKLKENTVEN